MTKKLSTKAIVKKLLREGRSAALATLMPTSGDPYCSLVNVASSSDGSPILLISKMAIHTKNALADSRASIMIDERSSGDPLEVGRIMLSGTLAETKDPVARRRYLARHPGAEMYADFVDFGFYKMTIKNVHLVAGFGRIVDHKPEAILTDLTDADKLVAAESGMIAHMNQDHADTCNLYATKLLKATDGDWKCVGIDPEGIELQRGQSALRLAFPERVTTALAARKALIELADKARQPQQEAPEAVSPPTRPTKEQMEAWAAAGGHRPAKPADTAKPAAEEPKPVADAPKPAAEEPKPVADAAKPAAEEPKPVADAAKPAAEEPKPAPDTAK